MIWRLGAYAVAAVVALPLLGVASSLFTAQGELWRHLAETQLQDIAFNTVVLLLGVGLGTVVIGTGTAWLVTMCRFPGVGLLQWALLLPLVMPTYIIGYAYADLLAFAGPLQAGLRTATGWSRGEYWFPDLGSAAGVAFLFTLVLYPYVYLAARASFLTQSPALLEASRILGNGPWRTFLRIGLPLARPAIAAGAALALLETLADFGTVQYYGVHTFTTAIYRTWYGMGNREGAAQISLVLIAIAVALILLCAAGPSVGQNGESVASRVPLFSCATDTLDNMLAVTGAVDVNGDIGDLLFTAPDGTVWPIEGAADPKFYLSVSDGPEGDLIEVAFGGPDRQFRLFSLVTPADPNVKDSVAGGDGGLLMTGIDGKPQRLFTCIERPTVYQGDLEKATECNNRTSLGEAACNVMAPPPRTSKITSTSARRTAFWNAASNSPGA